LPPAVVRGLAAVALVASFAAGATAQPGTPPAPLYRVFLLDGRTLTSYGEFARVGDRVVLSIPLGAAGASSPIHLASVPASQVDWTATERYRDALRAEQYVASRGEADYAAVSTEVAGIVGRIAATTDREAQLALAEQARARLAAWPADHFNYRAEDVRQILGVLDEVVADLRASAGQTRFDLALVANPLPPAPVALLPPPTLQESIEQALTAADLSPTAEERTALLRTALGTIDAHRPALPAPWASATRANASRALRDELELTRRYATLQDRALRDANRAAARADVAAVERVLAATRARDAKLGGRRPDVMTALVASLEERLDASRRLRLARDQWEARRPALEAYRDGVRVSMADLGRLRASLERIRAMSGPEPGRLPGVESRARESLRRLGAVAPPVEAATLHGVLVAATQMAANAAHLRSQAVSGNDMKLARDASAAAAGALMLGQRARDDLRGLTAPPGSR
jgi:hypothetical protein